MNSSVDPVPPLPIDGGLQAPSFVLPRPRDRHDRRLIFISALAVLIALGAGFAAEGLTRLIGWITNISFYGRSSTAFVSPADNTLGLWVILVPVAGALIVGILARYGSSAIRGHGIPEVMEQVLFNESRVSPVVTVLKPLSAAVSIGTGGPFGAEGPIIATGAALGSFLGQVIHISADERKVLLGAGAAAGMAATFGSPVAAVLLALELLLFEYRPRSLVPVALASAAATAVRLAFHGSTAVFAMHDIAQPGGEALAGYVAIGALVGLASVFVTKAVYGVEDAFERLPIHWMWWPALGGIVVGVVGYVAPRTLGVGYDNIQGIVTGTITGRALLLLVALKFISWVIALGSGTSGGTLAPLFTIGGGLGALLGAVGATVFPWMGLDPRIAGLVGMASMFAGASNAMLASVVFAFETTHQSMGLLPLLAGCSAAYLVSLMLLRNSIMTERLARRGAPIRTEYSADHLDHTLIRDHMTREVVALAADDSLETVREWLADGAGGSTHQGFPVIDDRGLIGVVTRRDLLDRADGAEPLRNVIRRPPAVVFGDHTLREAADLMVREGVGRLPVVSRDADQHVIGMISRSDLLSAHANRLKATHSAGRTSIVTLLRGGRVAEVTKGSTED
ncbi:MAG: chloride channel protein [Gemmatimonadota bacterium]